MLPVSFYLLSALVAAGFVFLAGWARRGSAAWAAAGTVAWMALTGGLAASGVLARFDTLPPPLFPLVAATLTATVVLAFSSLGTRMALDLPLWVLVGSQTFRFPLELAMHRAAEDGVMPPQMSYSGLNFDILTGLAALALGLAMFRGRVPEALVSAWNAAGLALLVNVVTIAILSTPTPFRVFLNDPPNTWVTQVPYVWLPTVMVPAALLGHLLVFRRLKAECRRCRC